ncbi:hypothetical protein OIO90_005447 [Microbotryomycetes sp. JL221]|nr:hypothetical protein OIO90_005447 [Microbotryomycetes sp. JL221]
MPSSEDDDNDLNDFYIRKRPMRPPSPTMSPGASSSVDNNNSRSGRDDGSAAEGSSDLEILDNVINKRRRKSNKTYKVTNTSTKRRVAAGDSTATTSKRRIPTLSPPPVLLNTATQERAREQLFAMAMEVGWQPPPPLGVASDSTAAGDEERQRRARSSTAGTTPSIDGQDARDRIKAGSKAKGKQSATKPVKKSKPTSSRRRQRDVSSSPQLETVPVEPLAQPPPPEDFWGATEKAKVKKSVTGDMTISAQLRAMSKLSPLKRGIDIADLVEDVENDDDDDDSDVNAPAGYETVAAKQKRLRAEQLEKARRKREAKKVNAPVVEPRQSSGILELAFAKQASRTEECPVCLGKFSGSTIQAHVVGCVNALEPSSDVAIIEPKTNPPIKEADNVPTMTNHPTPPMRVETNQNEQVDLARELFPPSSSPPPHRPGIALRPNNGKGKGKAVFANEPDDYDEVFDNDFFDDEEILGEVERAESNRIARNADETVWDEEYGHLADGNEDVGDEEDEIEIISARRVATGKRQGPPSDGSPPPAGSLYISMMPAEIRQGYEAMFAVKKARGGGPTIDDEKFGLAPQKLQATRNATKGKTGGARRGRGGGKFFWRGRGRGRGRR